MDEQIGTIDGRKENTNAAVKANQHYVSLLYLYCIILLTMYISKVKCELGLGSGLLDDSKLSET